MNTSTRKTALITGPTSGIGRETALELGRRGFKLFSLCRNRAAGEALSREISALPNAVTPHLLIADLGNFNDVRAAAKEMLDTGEPLHVLINNAGIVNTQHVMIDGIEQMFQVNHLGHFLLTNLLLDKLKASAPSRIVIVASNAHVFCKGIQFDDFSFANNFKTFPTYGHSKLANMLMCLELGKQLEGSGVLVNCLHPGAVATNLGNNGAWYAAIIKAIVGLFFFTPQKGAQTSIYLATTDDVTTSGGYYYLSKIYRSRSWARDANAAKKLWEVSKQLVNIEV